MYFGNNINYIGIVNYLKQLNNPQMRGNNYQRQEDIILTDFNKSIDKEKDKKSINSHNYLYNKQNNYSTKKSYNSIINYEINILFCLIYIFKI